MNTQPNICGDNVIFIPAPDPCDESTCDLQAKTATQNGLVLPDSNYDGLSQVMVDVPNTFDSGDEGKVVHNGALVSQTSATYDSNGTYDTTLVGQVSVALPDATNTEY